MGNVLGRGKDLADGCSAWHLRPWAESGQLLALCCGTSWAWETLLRGQRLPKPCLAPSSSSGLIGAGSVLNFIILNYIIKYNISYGLLFIIWKIHVPLEMLGGKLKKQSSTMHKPTA